MAKKRESQLKRERSIQMNKKASDIMLNRKPEEGLDVVFDELGELQQI